VAVPTHGLMSHPTPWTCRSCRAPFGRVRDGVLRPLVPVESVDSRGVVRLRCLRCGRARHWFPAGAAAAVAKHRGPADRHSLRGVEALRTGQLARIRGDRNVMRPVFRPLPAG
jgi:hypothetical protein